MTTDVTDASDNWAIAVRVRWFFRACELCRLVETIRFKMGERSSCAANLSSFFSSSASVLRFAFLGLSFRYISLLSPPPPDPCDYSPLFAHCYYYHLYKYITISIHNSQLTITITWSVVQPNVRRPLYITCPVTLLNGVLVAFQKRGEERDTLLSLQ